MVINTNITSQKSAGMLATSSANLAKSLQRLSSGSKITSPEDDAAGLAVSMRFDAQSARVGAASTNVANAISFAQSQDGYLQQVSKALTRMSELAVAAQDVTKGTTDRQQYQLEFGQLQEYVNKVSDKTFNGKSLFDGGSVTVTTGSENTDTWVMSTITFDSTVGSITAAAVGITTETAAATAAVSVAAAINDLATARATVGSNLSRLNYVSSELAIQKTNIDAANSRIKDVDVAQESTNYAKLNILVQSGTAMLAQANAMPQSVLRLLG
jgi:flagellin